jgi:hypothetical protein
MACGIVLVDSGLCLFVVVLGFMGLMEWFCS